MAVSRGWAAGRARLDSEEVAQVSAGDDSVADVGLHGVVAVKDATDTALRSDSDYGAQSSGQHSGC